jgi:hypothetical protein
VLRPKVYPQILTNVKHFALLPVQGRMISANSSTGLRDADSWAQNEMEHFSGCENRLRRRLVGILTDCSRHPGASLPQALGSWSKVKGAYRCLSNPKVQPQDLLTSHMLATWQRMGAHEVVLAVADTTSLNHTSHPATTGLGPIHIQGSSAQGMHLHSVLAFSQQGEPLGLLHASTWVRTQVRGLAKNNRDKNRRSFESKESHRWLEAFEAVVEQSRQQWLAQTTQGASLKQRPQPRVIMVADREADIYELFLSAQNNLEHCGLLVRALHPRRLEEDGQIVWEHLQEQPELGRMSLTVPAQGTRRARIARLSVRSVAVTLSVPQDKKKHFGAKEPLHLWAIETVEIDPPAGVTPLHWKLLSTQPAQSFEQASLQLGWYAKRWGIEVFHMTLKSGCHAEKRQLTTRENLGRMLMVDAIVAWRVMAIKQAARMQGESSASKWFSEVECKVMSAWASKHAPTDQAPSIEQMVDWLARLGGFIGRKSDGLPGVKTIWLGMQSLRSMVELWNVFPSVGKP